MRCLPLLGALLLAVPAAAAEPDAIRSRLEQLFPVQVLELTPAEHDGRPVYVATVMVRPGNFNDALRVERLLVDAQSGALIRPSGGGIDAAGTDYQTHQEGLEKLAPPRRQQ